jgi:hypothetical protein
MDTSRLALLVLGNIMAWKASNMTLDVFILLGENKRRE